MEINFPPKKGISINKFLPSACPNDLKDILSKLLAYDPNDRITAESALKHEYFSEFSQNTDNITSVPNKDFRSTFFTMKQSHIHSKEKS